MPTPSRYEHMNVARAGVTKVDLHFIWREPVRRVSTYIYIWQEPVRRKSTYILYGKIQCDEFRLIYMARVVAMEVDLYIWREPVQKMQCRRYSSHEPVWIFLYLTGS